MQNHISIGQILKPQGLKGEVKVKALTDDPIRFKGLKAVFVDGKNTPIERVSFMGDFVILKFSDISDRDMAETLRGKFLSVDKQDAIDPGDGFFIADLIGSSVLDDTGQNLGVIVDINAFGSADVIECKSIQDDKKEKKFRFPHLQHVVKKVDTNKKEFVVFSEELASVVVYDD